MKYFPILKSSHLDWTQKLLRDIFDLFEFPYRYTAKSLCKLYRVEFRNAMTNDVVKFQMHGITKNVLAEKKNIYGVCIENENALLHFFFEIYVTLKQCLIFLHNHPSKLIFSL